MMETYAERLQKRKRGKMSNYDMDEIERERDRNSFASVKIGDTEEPQAAVTVELPDDVVLKLALHAHEKDITLNKMCGIVLKDGLKNFEYRYEHQSKPQVLKEF